MRRSLPQPCGWRADPQVFGRPPPGCVLHFSRTFGMRSRRSLDDLVLRTGRRRHVGRDKARLRWRRRRRGRPARIALIAAAGAASAGAVAAALAADDAGSAASGAHARADGSASAAGPTLEDGSGTAPCAGIAPAARRLAGSRAAKTITRRARPRLGEGELRSRQEAGSCAERAKEQLSHAVSP